jgi:hypothetical protein
LQGDARPTISVMLLTRNSFLRFCRGIGVWLNG